MKKPSLALAGAVTVLLALSPVHAQDARPRLYAEMGYTQLHYKATHELPVVQKFSSDAVSGVLGYQLFPNLSVEGMFAKGLGRRRIDVTYAGTPVPLDATARVVDAVGVFVRPSFALSDRVELFARLGWVDTKVESMWMGRLKTDRDGSAAHGVGANFNLSTRSYIQANWMTYYKKTRFMHERIDGFNVAYGVRF